MIKLYHIVVTGKIGSGKSSVSKFLFQHLNDLGLDFKYCDFDEIVKEIWSQEDWKAHCLKKFGITSKKEMSEKAFENNSLLAEVASDMNPFIIEKVQQYLQYKNVLFDIPLHWQFNLIAADLCLLVTADDMTREKRATARLDWSEEKFKKVDALQLKTSFLKEMSDHVVINENKSLEDLKSEVLELALNIKSALDFKTYNRNFIPDKILNSYLKSYFKEFRAYHTAEHLLNIMKALKKAKVNLNDPFYFLAVLFHDLVYEVSQDYFNNEENSAKAFLKDSSFLLKSSWLAKNPCLVLEVMCAIQSTKGHRIQDPLLLPEQSLEKIKLFLDADLSILGASPLEFDKYAKNIKREFSHLEHAVFEKSRSEFLMKAKKSLQNNELYLTPLFRDKLYKKTLKNISKPL